MVVFVVCKTSIFDEKVVICVKLYFVRFTRRDCQLLIAARLQVLPKPANFDTKDKKSSSKAPEVLDKSIAKPQVSVSWSLTIIDYSDFQ